MLFTKRIGVVFEIFKLFMASILAALGHACLERIRHRTEDRRVSFGYREHAPSPALARHVACFWTLRGAGPALEAGAPWRVLPDGAIDIVFDLTAAVEEGGRFVGAMTRPVVVSRVGATDRLGVRFRPGGARPFLEAPAGLITDATLPLEDGWRAARGLASELAELDGTARRLARLERALLGQLELAGGRRELDPMVEWCAARIAAGARSLADLRREVAVGERQLERRFLLSVGLPPKRFERVMRFRRILEHFEQFGPLGPRTPNWATLALDLGYSDQAHLAREVKAMSGLTPSRLWGPGPA
jgi:AraC-like DNA-binding protein